MSAKKRRQHAREARLVGLSCIIVFAVLTLAIYGWLALLQTGLVAFGVLCWCVGTDELDRCPREPEPIDVGLSVVEPRPR